MTKDQIIQALTKLNDELAAQGIKGEIGVVGGAAMVLAFNARQATKDVDAVFMPASTIRQIAQKISHQLKLPQDWLNDAVKGFMPEPLEGKQVLFDMPALSVWIPPPQYLLAMKAISARFDSHDAQDLKTLIAHLKITKIGDVLEVIEHYYPRNAIPAKTQFFLEEIFEAHQK